MRRISRITAFTLCCCLSFFARQSESETIRTRWSKVFAKPVDWYERTSVGVVVIKAGKSFYALKEEDGEQLWMLPVVRATGKTKGSLDASALRGQDVLEVPGMGVLLMNHVKVDGEKDGRLIALNLQTGKRLWARDEIDELMTALPIYGTGDAVIVCRRVQKKVLAAETAALAATQIPFALVLVKYPYRFEVARIDLGTGIAKWNTEYERTFTPGTESIKTFGGRLFVYVGNRVMTSISLVDGKFEWEDGKMHLGTIQAALPFEMVNGELIYKSEYVRAIDPATQKELWSLEDLGRVTGLAFSKTLAVALGEKAIAAMDLETGKERWRNKVNSGATNLVWDKASDSLVYIDKKGLHSVEAQTGKTILDAPLSVASWPSQVRLASAEIVVTVAEKEVCGYNFRTGKKLFNEGNLVAFFRANTAIDTWPRPADGQAFDSMSRPPANEEEWAGLRKTSLLGPETLKQFEEREGSEESLEAFETETQVETLNVVNRTVKTVRKLWWIDPKTNQKVEITPSGDHHEVDRRLGMVFAVNKVQMWGARVEQEEKVASAGKPGN